MRYLSPRKQLQLGNGNWFLKSFVFRFVEIQGLKSQDQTQPSLTYNDASVLPPIIVPRSDRQIVLRTVFHPFGGITPDLIPVLFTNSVRSIPVRRATPPLIM
ncbi:hypothetical protein J6590_090215 [Homalodisca vitripennis]|nr:hypothetical protein J6590_090215 [Homalodisca vitripennis]